MNNTTAGSSGHLGGEVHQGPWPRPPHRACRPGRPWRERREVDDLAEPSGASRRSSSLPRSIAKPVRRQHGLQILATGRNRPRKFRRPAVKFSIVGAAKSVRGEKVTTRRSWTAATDQRVRPSGDRRDLRAEGEGGADQVGIFERLRSWSLRTMLFGSVFFEASTLGLENSLRPSARLNAFGIGAEPPL